MSTRPVLRDVLRDTITWLGGWVLIFKQAGILFDPPQQVSEVMVGAALVMIGVPGIAQLWAARSGGVTSTGGSPQQPPSPPSPSSSSGASSPAGETA